MIAMKEAFSPSGEKFFQSKISAERMPLSFVPGPEKRPHYSSDLLNVAGHELNHALVALAYGVSVSSLSIIPEGNSLGRTVLAGLVSPEIMKIVAAGGGVGAHDGHAEGFGSDKFKVDIMHHFNGGQSWEAALIQAGSAIAKYSPEIRRKAAEIIAYLQEIPGHLIPIVLLRAEMEINEELNISNESLFEKVKQPISSKEKQAESRVKEYTIIDTLPNDTYKITYFVGKKIEREERFCGECHEVNGHKNGCFKRLDREQE